MATKPVLKKDIKTVDFPVKIGYKMERDWFNKSGKDSYWNPVYLEPEFKDQPIQELKKFVRLCLKAGVPAEVLKDYRFDNPTPSNRGTVKIELAFEIEIEGRLNKKAIRIVGAFWSPDGEKIYLKESYLFYHLGYDGLWEQNIEAKDGFITLSQEDIEKFRIGVPANHWTGELIKEV